MMIQRRAKAAGLRTKISAHSFRATGITTYLQNGGKSKSRSTWPGMDPPEQQDYMTAEAVRLNLMKWSVSLIERNR